MRQRLDRPTIVLLIVLWVGAIVAAVRPAGYDAKLVLVAVVAIATAFIFVVRFLSHDPNTRRLLPLRIGISIALASLAFYSGRELINEFALVFLVPILYYATRFGTPAGLAAAITSSLALFVVYLLKESFGIGADLPGLILFVVIFCFAALVAGVVIDESQRKKSELELYDAVDGLTGLASRRHFDYILAREFERAKRNRSDLGLIMLVVDRLERLNHTYGRKCEEAILLELAGLVRLNVGAGGLVARYAGDTFVALLPAASAATAGEVEERLVSSVGRYVFQCDAGFVQVSVSVGRVVYPGPDIISGEDLVQAANTACMTARAIKSSDAGSGFSIH